MGIPIKTINTFSIVVVFCFSFLFCFWFLLLFLSFDLFIGAMMIMSTLIFFRFVYCFCFSVFRITTLDVMMFSYLHTILTSDLPSRELGKIVQQFPNLVTFHQTISEILTKYNQYEVRCHSVHMK